MALGTSDNEATIKEAEANVAIAATELQAAQKSFRDREDRYLGAVATLHQIKSRIYQGAS